ncbi:MAG: hypothetical protein J5497_03760, partial [Selenomonadaceae bacterium]|nr:hypothetical protein [Selenomonadaceae bacterium]
SEEPQVVTEAEPANDEPPVVTETEPVSEKPELIREEPVVKKFEPPPAPKSVLEEIPDDQKDFPLEKVFKPLAIVKPAEADKPVKLEEKPDPAEKFPLQEVFKPLAVVKPAEADKPVKPAAKPSGRAEFFPLQEVFTPLSMLKPEKIEELTREERIASSKVESAAENLSEEKFDTLDEILDRAYAERDKGHVWQAIELYRKALENYRNDEYAPFVAIDLGNIYKEQALYSKAIKIYEDALTLPAVQRNATIKKDFLNNLRYLRIVRDVLMRHRASATPFTKLPKNILQEIDAEFQRMQLNSAQ